MKLQRIATQSYCRDALLSKKPQSKILPGVMENQALSVAALWAEKETFSACILCVTG